jgi:hypothetical protein
LENGLVAVTSLDYVRFFSLSGVQTFVFSASGPIVSVGSHRNLVIVAFHNGAPLGSKLLQCIVFYIEWNYCRESIFGILSLRY